MKKLIAVLLLSVGFVYAEEQKHQWIGIQDGGSSSPSIFIDKLSIKRTKETISFTGSTQLPPSIRVKEFDDQNGKTIKLAKPAAIIIYRTTLNCLLELYTKTTTDYYDTKWKLIFSYRPSLDGETFTVKPGYDTTYMFMYLCHKKLSPKSET